MRTSVEFRSGKFPAYDGESEQINPDRWGQRLAEYLNEKLREEGVQTGEIYAEDWGWGIPIRNDAFPMWVGCGNYDRFPDGFLVFIEPSKSAIRIFLKRIDTTEAVTKVSDALDRILTADPDIQEVRWWIDTER